MAERIPRYFHGQVPPPPPPPPPPPAATNGTTSAVPGQQPYAFGYNYSRGYGLSRAPVSTLPNKSTLGDSRLRKSNNSISGERRSSNKLETNETTPDITTENLEQKCFPTTAKAAESITAIKSSNIWTCKDCNITLESEKALKGHRKSHVKCSDCPFEGSPKIVKAHYQAKHGKFSGSGFKTVTVALPGCRVQKFKICVGNRPEDIQKWIEERKKRFPRSQASTTSNNTKATDEKGPSHDSKTAVTISTDQEQESSAKGLSSLLAGYGSSDDDSENDDKEEKMNSIKPPTTSLTPTGQESINVKEQSEQNTDAVNTTETEQNNIYTPASPAPKDADSLSQGQKPKINRPCRFFFRNGSCRNGDNCRFSHDAQARNQSRSSASRAAQNKNSSSNAKKRKRGGHISSDTLLRRLLRNDMERESTLSMQLLKFIVDNNFFRDEDSRAKDKHQRILTSRDELL